MAATVEIIAQDDIPDVAGFLARQLRPGEAVAPSSMTPERRLRWLLLDNPHRIDGVPIGWRIRDEGAAVVGAAVCITYRLSAEQFTTPALMFAKFFVDPEYRGMGLGIFMRFVREGRRFPLFCSSTNAKSGELFSRFGGAIIPGMDHTMLGVRRAKPLVEEWLFRKTNRPWLARSLAIPAKFVPRRPLGRRGRGSDAAGLCRVQHVDEAAAICLASTSESIAITRDRDYLRWRYFSGERDNYIYRFRHAGEPDRMAVVTEIRSGNRGQIRVLNVQDVWPPLSFGSAGALAAALQYEYASRFDVIWLRGQSPAAEEGLKSAGFIRHDFPAPLGWYIDGEKSLPPAAWYLMPGESE